MFSIGDHCWRIKIFHSYCALLRGRSPHEVISVAGFCPFRRFRTWVRGLVRPKPIARDRQEAKPAGTPTRFQNSVRL
ncbi:hypothetical protein IF2G_08998 [Cordyceps javanica]|nr:hypothetical protein IF2G_08998 [Cordyceps javanica]